MLEGYEKLNILTTDDRTTGVTFEVNWDESNPDINECKILKMKTPDGQEFYVKKEMFMAFLWAIGDPDEQRKMIPQKLIHTKWYETVLSVKATKDIAKGEEITFPIKISLPAIEEEAIAEIKREKLTSNLPII